MKRAILVSALALATAQAASAQTSIVPDTAPGIGLGTTVSPAGNIYTIDGGTVAGQNLFHSFNAFSVGAGDVAQWVHTAGDPASINNVVNRVTGGSPSSIGGWLDSTAIPNADFYFINPAGIVFDSGAAHVNVPAAVHFSTASELHFSNGDTFSIATPSGSTLSMAPPQAFGFVGNEGSIVASNLLIQMDDAISLSAGNIALIDSFFNVEGAAVSAVGDAGASVTIDGVANVELNGSLNLIHSSFHSNIFQTGSARTIRVNAGPVLMWDSGFSASANADPGDGSISFHVGDLVMDDSSISSFAAAGGLNGGSISIDADSLLMWNGSAIGSNTSFGSGGQVELDVAGAMAMDGSVIFSTSNASGNGGGIDISAASLEMTGGSAVTSGSEYGDAGSIDIEVEGTLRMQATGVQGTAILTSTGRNLPNVIGEPGNAGEINVTARDIVMEGAIIRSNAYGAGDGGQITLTADSLTMSAGATINTDATETGQAGSIDVNVAGLLAMTVSSMTSLALAGGTAGDISIDAGLVELTSSVLASDTFSTGRGGSIAIVAGELFALASEVRAATVGGTGEGGRVDVNVAGDAILFDGSAIYSDAIGEGNAGDVSVSARSLFLLDNSRISSNSTATGDGGDVSVQAELIELQGGRITSDAYGSGEGGNVVVISAGGLNLSQGGYISSNAIGDGNAGGVSVSADTLQLTGPSRISSDAEGNGNAGGVQVSAGSLQLTSGTFISSDAYGSGDAGSVTVELSRDMQLGGNSRISSDVKGEGNAGDVTVAGGTLLLTESSRISSNSAQGSSGNAGNVFVSGSQIELSGQSSISSDAQGEGNAGAVHVEAADLQLGAGTRVSSSTFGAGDAGGVLIRGGNVALTNALIASDAAATGNAGGVAIDVDQLTLNDSAIRSEASSLGAGGEIDVTVAGQLGMLGSGITTNSVGTGNAGSIGVTAGTIVMGESSAISSDALSSAGGQSGSVSLATGKLAMTEASKISTSSANANAAGQVEILADALSLSGDETKISSENSSAIGGAAGTVTITAASARIEDGASITTNSLNGAAGNINIQMPSDSWLILSGDSAPGRITTSSGPGTGGVITISSPLAIISNGGIISALGESGGANVQIDAQYFIASADRENIIEVDGTLTFSNAIYDVSAGTTDADLSILDASGVLQGQCSAMRASGNVSQLNISQSGPFGAPGWSDILPRASEASAGGGCQ